MIVTITMNDITQTESVISELSEVLKEFKGCDAVKDFTIRDMKMRLSVNNETFDELLTRIGKTIK